MFENHWSKVDIELNSNFQLRHRYFFLKYFNKNSRKNFRRVLNVLIVLSSEGSNQLQLLYVRTLGIFLHRILFYWSCGHQMIPQQFFFWIIAEVLGVSHIRSPYTTPTHYYMRHFPRCSIIELWVLSIEFLLMNAHRVLNRLSECANVSYRKNEVFL